MNITFLYDIIHPEHGGIGRVTCALSDYFRIHGHRVSYFLAKDSGYPLNKKHVIQSGNFSLSKENREEFLNFLKAGMTSAYEGWAMVLVEASAYGCIPVVFDFVTNLLFRLRYGMLAPAWIAYRAWVNASAHRRNRKEGRKD